MSAILGVFCLDGRPLDSETLEQMLQVVSHRGPDGSGVWKDGSVGFGHRMLWTTPESLREQLPLLLANGELVLTADARIDNRSELIGALELTDRRPEEINDGELILQAYRRWGRRCPEQLLGDFAFAVWDRKKRSIFCARDHRGIKPFYYYRSTRTFVFASEVKSILCLPDVPHKLNELKLAYYLTSVLEDKVLTFYKGIYRLPPGHRMVVSPEEARIDCYWTFDISRKIRYGSDEEYSERFRELFTEAVRCRLRSAYPVGCMLSGGLDSSSVVCLARKELEENGRRPLRTFSIVFDDAAESDESPYFRAVIQQGGLKSNYIQSDEIRPGVELDSLLWHQDEPFWTPYAFLYSTIYRTAHEQGIRIVMDGSDGDSTVSHGVAYLTELAFRGKWPTLARELNAYCRLQSLSRMRVLRQWVVAPLVPEPVRQVWRSLRGSQPTPYGLSSIIDPGFAKRINLPERLNSLRHGRLKLPRTLKEHHHRQLNWEVYQLIMEVQNKAAAAFSIEPRHPCFDKRLAEFCLALPPQQRLHRGWTRMILRRAMEDLLPKEVCWRAQKAPISPALVKSFLDFEGEILEDVTLGKARVLEGYVDLAAVQAAYRSYGLQPGPIDACNVWRAASLALWLHRTGLCS